MICAFGRWSILRAAIMAAGIVSIQAPAREISSAEAGNAAAAWVRRDMAPLGVNISSAEVAEVSTAKDGGVPLFHIVRMVGGGVVVTSAESGATPVVAFLGGGDIEEAAGNPLWEVLCADMSNRIARIEAVRAESVAGGAKGVRLRATAVEADPFAAEEAAWAELLSEEGKPQRPKLSASISDASGISDLRVPALISTQWDQSNGAGNYYTPPFAIGAPSNYVCGCVALAGAQIANFWRFPVESRPQVSRDCYVNGAQASYMTMGGTYDWANMPDCFYYVSALTPAQKQAAGRLCYDFGVAAQMDWGLNGSGTSTLCLTPAFVEVFGYANAMSFFYAGGPAMSGKLAEKSILANLDAGCPVVLGLDGHAVVADGYGYASSTLYTHLNFGWSGLADAWYNLPDVNVSYPSYRSSILHEVIYNIFPQEAGELLTGRVLDASGNPVSGATVTATNGSDAVTGTANARGIYALHVAGGKRWTVTAASGLAAGSLSVDVAASSSAVFTRTGEGSTIYKTGTVGNSWGNDITVVAASGYAAWAAANGIGAADAVTGGQPNLIRYVFNVPSGEFSPVAGVTFQDGNPVLIFRAFNPDVSGVTLSVLSTTNLLDWTHAEEIPLPSPPFSGIVFSHQDTAPSRFYKLKVEEN